MSSFLKDLYTAATDLAKDATDFALNKTDLEKKLDEVLSDKNYGTPTSALREIAAATSYQYVILSSPSPSPASSSNNIFLPYLNTFFPFFY
jgi:hypothetical protein